MANTVETPTDRVAAALIGIGVPAMDTVGQWVNVGDGSLFVVPVPLGGGDEYSIPQPLVQRGNRVTTGIVATIGDSAYLMGWPRIVAWLQDLKRSGLTWRLAPLTLGVMKRFGQRIPLEKAA